MKAEAPRQSASTDADQFCGDLAWCEPFEHWSIPPGSCTQLGQKSAAVVFQLSVEHRVELPLCRVERRKLRCFGKILDPAPDRSRAQKVAGSRERFN